MTPIQRTTLYFLHNILLIAAFLIFMLSCNGGGGSSPDTAQIEDNTALTSDTTSKTWHIATVISVTAENAVASDPQIAFDSSGNAMAVWE